jgi:Arc/MetJ family transcription regulator
MGEMVSIDKALLAEARAATGTDEAEAVVAQALREVIARANARAIMAFSGSDPDAWIPARRHTSPE